jgi:hypothetical protein
MTGPTISYRTSFRRQRESRLTAPPSPPCASVAPQAVAAPTVTPIARALALAHQVERLVEAGGLKDYREAARQLGMCGSHMTHVTNLLRLSPGIQEAILLGHLDVTERGLRPICALTLWDDQLESLEHSCGRRRPARALPHGDEHLLEREAVLPG